MNHMNMIPMGSQTIRPKKSSKNMNYMYTAQKLKSDCNVELLLGQQNSLRPPKTDIKMIN